MTRKIPEEEAITLGLPMWSCCCADHTHDWHEVVDADEKWIECGACGKGARWDIYARGTK